MTRIGDRFARLKGEGRTAFIAFLTAGDPSLERSVDLALEAEAGGADILELGVPFSDPVADGPVIQRASDRALAAGATLRGVLDVARRIREQSELPLLLFSYMNPLVRLGLARSADAAREAGIDGVLVTDLPPEEAKEWSALAHDRDLDTVFLAAPTSPEQRLRTIAEASSGFVYAVSRTGVTGERDAISGDATPLVQKLRAAAPVPVALGFGISTPEQCAAAAVIADGVVVGSALVRHVEEHPEADLSEKLRWLKGEI